jgi:L-fucose isomerase-like protein
MNHINKELRIGIVPTRRKVFDHPEAERRKNEVLNKIKGFEETMKFTGIYIDDLVGEGLLKDYDESLIVRERMLSEKVDALFIPHCNFGQEEAIARLSKDLNVPVLIWGPRDAAPDGYNFRPTDSQCGMFASTKVLQRYNVTFSYIENCSVEDPVFEKEFAQFLAVANVIKAFRNMRIAVISTRPKEFLSVMINEAELLEKFDIELVPCESTVLIGMIENHLKNNTEGKEKILKDMDDKGIDMSRLGDKKDAWASVILALIEFAKMHKCTAIASECWRMIRTHYGFMPCSVFGELYDYGIPCTCETDVHGAILSAMAIAARRYETPAYLADLTIRHPHNENAELLWHCGPYAKSLKKGPDGHIVESGQAYFEIIHGEHTLMRFDGLKGEYYMFVGKGKGVDGPVTNGTYLWMETDNWVHWEKKFMFGPYIHHVVGIPGDITAVMRESCRYLGIHYDCADSNEFVYNLS